MSTIFGQTARPVNLSTGKPLDNFVQWATDGFPLTTPDKEGEPGLPVSIFKHGIYRREHRLEDPRHLWLQRYNGSAQNRRAGFHAELPEEREPQAVNECGSTWEPIPEPRLPDCREVYQHFAKLVGVRCALAGGALRDELSGNVPKDYDLFTFGQFDKGAVLATGCEVLDDKGTEYAGFSLQACLTVLWRGVRVQIIHRPERGHDVDSLLDSFDWQFCCVALDDGGLVSRIDPSKIGPGNLLRLNSTGAASRTAVRTLRRGFRFTERFGMQIHDGDLAALCAEIISGYADTHAEFSTAEIVKG
jgi:hypothetical protein